MEQGLELVGFQAWAMIHANWMVSKLTMMTIVFLQINGINGINYYGHLPL